jgi:hypothetical protein
MVEVARLAIPPHVADRVLNHQSGTISGIAAVYNRFAYLDERRDALNAWGRFVEGLAQSEEVASPSSGAAMFTSSPKMSSPAAMTSRG